MEIKRRLNAVAKDLTPEIEAMNIGQEMLQMCKRLEELVAYGIEKCAKAKRQRDGHETNGAKMYRKLRETRTEIQSIHNAEADELMRDQQQHNAQPDVVDAG